jgi:hypothetical protein
MIKQNIVCENAKVQGLDVQERYVQVQDELSKNSSLLGNKFKYDMYDKCNQLERKDYPQVMYYEYKISYHEF